MNSPKTWGGLRAAKQGAVFGGIAGAHSLAAGLARPARSLDQFALFEFGTGFLPTSGAFGPRWRANRNVSSGRV